MSQELPPASITSLVQMLATQTMVALGKIPIPGQAEPKKELAAARHFIELLDVLVAKTKGNLTSDEASLLERVAHELRLAYVAEKSH
jgi:beta-lactamase superfamily II metal-dependent hydrolase